MGELWRRLWYLLNRSRFERELREDMDAHRALKGASGPPFGNDLRLRDEALDAWGWRWLERLTQDLRFASRLLWRSPVFTFTPEEVCSRRRRGAIRPTNALDEAFDFRDRGGDGESAHASNEPLLSLLQSAAQALDG
jgi:hypothetical protein